MDFYQPIKKLEGTTLYTLNRNKPFELLSVDDSQIIVRPQSTGKARAIPWIQLEGAFKELSVQGEISSVEIEKNHAPRNPVYISAVLSMLPNITYSVRPIRLKLQR